MSIRKACDPRNIIETLVLLQRVYDYDIKTYGR